MIVAYNYFQKMLLLAMSYLAFCNFIRLCYSKRKRVRRMREIYSVEERELNGFFTQLFKEIGEKEDGHFRSAVCMGKEQFESLFSLLSNRLEKHSHRKPIESKCRLVLTLVFLSQGTSWQMLSAAFKMGSSTVRGIILETCDIIWDELNDLFLSKPTDDEWKKVALDFYTRTGMPNCLGPIDSKHFRIKNSQRCFASVVLLAACDSNYCFTAVDIGTNDTQINGKLLQATNFGRKFFDKNVALPSDSFLPNTKDLFPYYFVADTAFPLRRNIMRPYTERNLSADKEDFNKKLTRIKTRIENTFGIMTARWRVLSTALQCYPENAQKIVKAIVVLHNYVIMNDSQYCPDGFVDDVDADTKGTWRKDGILLSQCRLFTRYNASHEAFQLRNLLKEYLISNSATDDIEMIA